RHPLFVSDPLHVAEELLIPCTALPPVVRLRFKPAPRGFARALFLRPMIVSLASAVLLHHRAEEDVIIEPRFLLLPKRSERLVRPKSRERFVEKRALQLSHFVVVHSTGTQRLQIESRENRIEVLLCQLRRRAGREMQRR